MVLLEKDTHDDVLPAWSYPSVSKDQEQILIARSNLQKETIPLPFTYSKYKNHWVYIRVAPIESTTSPRLIAFGICLFCMVFLLFFFFESWFE